MKRVKGLTDVAELEAALSEPRQGLIDLFGRLPGDVIILGAAGKMGPTLARMAKRASDAAGDKRKVIAVSRFSQIAEEGATGESGGAGRIQADLLDDKQLRGLPDAPLVVFMAGMKFGAQGNEPLTWAMNTLLPAKVCEKYAKSRISAFSTGNV